ncbi:MAG: cyclic nucleotide-binding domain-containing protein [Gammaproteobacteria bacterium]|nr:cyclic nucleotide-binding domain-containing protein [Gammaproteobacteria bacterium]
MQRFLEQCPRCVVPSRTLLVRSGEAPDALFYVLAESVEVLIEDEYGKELVLAYLGKGEFFGEIGLLEATLGRGAHVRAFGRTEIAEMAYSRCLQVAASDPVLALELAAQLAARLERATRKLRDLAFIDVSGRILQALGEQPDALTHPRGIQIRVSRRELARRVGCSREMAGRVLHTLKERGTLRARGETVVMPGVRPARLLAAQTGAQPAAASMAPRMARTVAA